MVAKFLSQQDALLYTSQFLFLFGSALNCAPLEYNLF